MRRRRRLPSEQEGGIQLPVASLKTETPTRAPDSLVNIHWLIGNKAAVQLLQRAFRTNASTGAPALLTNMQEQIGNKATVQLLQRALSRDEATGESDTTSANEIVGAPVNAPDLILLTTQQVDRAMNFYAADPAKYTPDIIAKIQTEVGTTPTGVMDRATVQAVARHQAANPPLKVDGMAGPRTLPAVFRQGLDNEPLENRFADISRARVNKAAWIVAESPAFRLELLVDEANDVLKRIEVPKTDGKFHSLGNRPEIHFFNEEWKLLGFHPTFNDGLIEQEHLDSLLALTYRESRRAEQFFSMAKMLAGTGLKAPEIALRLGIPEKIAAQATPIQPGTPEFVVADGWFQSIFGIGAAHHLEVIQEFFAASDELKAAEDAAKADNSADNLTRLAAARERFEKAKNEKEDLPDEQDMDRVAHDFELVQKRLPAIGD